MSNKLTIGEKSNMKNIESLDLTRKVNILRQGNTNLINFIFIFKSCCIILNWYFVSKYILSLIL